MGATVVPSNTKVIRGWYECGKCYALFYCTDTSHSKADKRGLCAKGDTHSVGSIELKVTDTGAGQGKWYHCSTCSQLFYNGNSTSGTCSGGGTHTAGTLEMHLTKTTVDGVPLHTCWAHCKKCETLFLVGASGNGVCPKGGSHEASGSDRFALERAYNP